MAKTGSMQSPTGVRGPVHADARTDEAARAFADPYPSKVTGVAPPE